MKQIRKSIYIIPVVVLLIACNVALPVPSATATVPTNTATDSPATIPTNLPLSTETVVPEDQDELVENDCVDILPTMPANFTVTGIVPLEDFQKRITTFLNLATGDESQIPKINEWIADYAVSPDRKTLAYKNYDSSAISLTLVDVLNSRTQTIFSDQSDYALYYWLNNEELMLGKNGQWVIFNPYTNQKEVFSISDFPDYDTYNQYNVWIGFNPKKTLAIYKNKGGNTSLLDVDTKQLMGEVSDAVQRPPVAAWTVDGNQAAIIGATQLGQYLSQSGDNIFEVGQDGQAIQLTHLAEQYGVGFNIHSLSWSPNSRYIAFWMRNSEISDWHLAVLDIVAKQVIDYCISTDPYASSGQVLLGVSAPIWSPDSKQIIVEHRTSDSNYVVLLDITQNIAFQIAQNTIPLGWMVAP
jgi:Tol biopolymer transport system component